MKTVLFARHANIDLPRTTDDPVLNAAGVARAEELAHVLGAVHVESVFTSTRRRTKLTAAPLANRFGLHPEVVPPPEEFARQVLAGDLDAVIMVVGHSDTIPDMIAALGVAAPPTITDREFDNLFLVTIANSGETELLALKYGKPSLA
jgi:broad specificity phosphatase PhoE